MLRVRRSEQLVYELFKLADVEIGGKRPWDIQVLGDEFYSRLFKDGDVGFGEAYMDGLWECDRIDIFTEKFLKSKLYDKASKDPKMLLTALRHMLFNPQTKKGSKKVAVEHYDIGNNLYELMLDKDLSYSCGYWKHAKNLDEAQEHKLEMICQKLKLQPGMRLLDIGCGFGAMARHAAKYHGAHVVGVTLSIEQAKLARQRCEGLPVEIRVQDYRDVHEEFDRAVSIGMFEHVGYKNYDTYMRIVHRNLKKEGLFLLHTIGCNVSQVTGNRWMMKYIFPNSMLPSIKQIGESIEKKFVMEDWHNFGPDYALTLEAWYKNFNDNWPMIKEAYGERFRRMWNFYLMTCIGGFRARHLQLWQVTLSKGALEGYPVRDLVQG